MKPWGVVFLWLIASALVFVSKCSISSSSHVPLMFLPGSLPIRELSASSFNQQHQYRKIQVVREDRNRKEKGGSKATDFSRGEEDSKEEDSEEYHTDYHGVSTHPTPTPKHPKP
ncbi:hypothetical protein CsSME_00008712 [Camellia sinensis var. sinensis]|uniref:Uncharacterized protein n=1 Tax=Camellia sinensis TaxID=4442 RepID=A0A7J7HV86_CAMSI|nr:uncharacterized protein LOC114312708 [Camellia sinensis]KAF5956559.1 hypothetical protein HYC85_003784 [Camellia sinensis]